MYNDEVVRVITSTLDDFMGSGEISMNVLQDSINESMRRIADMY